MLQLTAVTMPLFGYPIVLLMVMPLGLSHLALALWLTVRGFDERPVAQVETHIDTIHEN